PKPRDAAFSRAPFRAAHKALVPAIRFAVYPSTGLPVKLSHVAYLASQRTPDANSSTKTKSSIIGFFLSMSATRSGRSLRPAETLRLPSFADNGCMRSCQVEY